MAYPADRVSANADCVVPKEMKIGVTAGLPTKCCMYCCLAIITSLLLYTLLFISVIYVFDKDTVTWQNVNKSSIALYLQGAGPINVDRSHRISHFTLLILFTRLF